MLIDKISYNTPIRNINPFEKFILSIGVLIFLLITKNKGIFILNFFLFNFIIIFIMKVSVINLLKLYIIPSFFIITTLIPMIWTNNDIYLFLFRTYSAISAIYFLVCSTPATDLDYIFEKFRFPKIFREMFLLIYRYIFILSDTKDKVLIAQKSRLGYKNYKLAKISFPILIVSILRKTYYYSQNSVKAAESRLGSEFIFYPRKYNKIGKEIFFIMMVLLINLILVVYYA